MELIYYTGINRLGRVIKGQVIAEDAKAAESYLLGINVSPLSCRLQDSKPAGWALHFTRYGFATSGLTFAPATWKRNRKLGDFSTSFARLLGGGVPVHAALSTLRYTERDPSIALAIESLMRLVAQGQSLSAAMATCRQCFEVSYVRLVVVGEKTGHLQQSLDQLGASLAWRADFEKRLNGAMAYPLVVGGLLLLLLIFLLVAVLPALVDFLDTTGNELPWHTLILLDISSLLQKFWRQLLLVVPLVAVVALWLGKRAGFATSVRDRVVLGLPVFGKILFDTNLAKYTHQLALLYQSGIDILEALEVAQNVVVNEYLLEQLQLIQMQVRDGVSFSDAMRSTGLFTPSSIQIAGIGEVTGELASSLDQISSDYSQQAASSLQTVETAAAPAMLLIVGLFLIWMIVSIFAPIYDSVINSGVSL